MSPILYGRVFFVLRHRFDLRFSACVLSDVIFTLSRKTGSCYASREYLAKVFGTSVRTVQRDLEALEHAGLITREGTLIQTTALWKDVTGRCR